jgi:methionine biosynthesis protein MetW
MAEDSILKYDYRVDDKIAKPYSIFAKINDLIPAGFRVLDVGCHTGQFGAVLKRKGCRVVGIEVNEQAAARARLVLDQVLVADVEEDRPFQQFQERFDAVLFVDLLEHCRFPERVLNMAQEVLTRDGFVIASIPNIANWEIRLNLLLGRFDYQPMGIMDESHLRFFTIKTATELFEAARYRIESMDHRYSLPVFRIRKFFGGTVAKLFGPMFPGLLSYQMIIKARPRQIQSAG